jgi:cytochrome c-type biogenesis protein CcmH
MLILATALPVMPVIAADPSSTGPGGLSPELADTLTRSERFRNLASELRCLVCQNQTLADSNAELAGDLRNEVLRQMALGKDDAQIKSHLVDRYGEFVLYRPTFTTHNLALWVGPAVLALIGAVVLWRISRRPGTAPAAALNDAELRHVERLLGDEPGTGPESRRG